MALMVRIFKMKFPWNIWVMFLGGVNILGAVVFFNSFEAKFALVGMFGSMFVMQIIYQKYGFVRLLGLGHIIFWVPFVAWNVIQLTNDYQMGEYFKFWLIAVSVLNALSLIFDIVDVYRFFKGETLEIS